MSSEPTPLPVARQLELFRNPEKRSPLHPSEKRLLVVLAAHLCLMPWALGTMHSWSQIVSLVLSILGFWLTLSPRIVESSDNGRTVCESLWPRLIRFPIFWLGLALLLYIVLQAANPSWQYQRNDLYWWLARVPNIGWLPTSVRAPFLSFNIWRQFIIVADTWLLISTIWVGLTRRRSLRILLAVLVVNALALGAVLVVERASGEIGVPPFISDTPRLTFTSTFIYRNHAGAYFSLLAFQAVALAAWNFDHGRRRLLKSTPAGVWALGATFLAGALFFTLSRGAVLSFCLGFLGVATWFVVRRLRQPAAPDSNPALAATIAAAFLLFAIVAVRYLDFSEISNRFDSLASQQGTEPSVSSRLLARSAAIDMIEDLGLRGVGAGCFRYLYQDYVKKYPEISQGGSMFWQHAHCDWLEFPIELGLAGNVILLGGAVWWTVWFVRQRVLWNSLAVILLLGCFQTLVHAGFDFPFQCPAILATWCALVTVAGKWAELERGT